MLPLVITTKIPIEPAAAKNCRQLWRSRQTSATGGRKIRRQSELGAISFGARGAFIVAVGVCQGLQPASAFPHTYTLFGQQTEARTPCHAADGNLSRHGMDSIVPASAQKRAAASHLSLFRLGGGRRKKRAAGKLIARPSANCQRPPRESAKPQMYYCRT